MESTTAKPKLLLLWKTEGTGLELCAEGKVSVHGKASPKPR